MFAPSKLFTVLAAFAATAAGFSPQCQSAEIIGADEPLDLTSAVNSAATYSFNRKDATYIAVHFASLAIPAGGRLTIRSPDESQVFEYTNKTQGNFYAEYIRGDTALLTYTPPRDTTTPASSSAFIIDKFAHGYPGDGSNGQTEAICGRDDTKAAVCHRESDAPKYKKAQAVARLFMNGRGLCTGWLLGSEGHLVTNNHCIGDESTASNTQFEFGAECKTCDDPENTKQLGCKGEIVATSSTFLYTSKTNDFTLVKLNLKATDALAKYGYLQARASGPVLGEPIYVAQHPAGKPTRIATVLDDGKVGTIESMSINSCVADEVGYSLDTEGGSSGSPVLSAKDNVVVALHNCGGCMNGAVKIDHVIDELTKNKLLPKDALAGTSPTSNAPTSYAPTPTSAGPTKRPSPTQSTSTPSPYTTTTPNPATTTMVPTTKKPKTCSPKSRKPKTRHPSTTTTAVPSNVPTTVSPSTPSPSSPGDCHGCDGCYSQRLGYCLPAADYTKDECARFSYFQTTWCGK
ncbi:Aste57867_2280 [Aphanomyces stellatus]|uniref:Aste57867_2280 protein n=1 Tax=Aphanomyces stellatus TaxID=120398 RepID=A0A485K9T1_9STRA|nr:hypothetical protein As57867_002275 [Aphanomyces stellatus]VFT79483.1 Aste57867_2280 [Aphanomyces stellatus]